MSFTQTGSRFSLPRFAAALAVASALAIGSARAQSKFWTDLGLGSPGCCGIPALGGSTPRYGEMLHLNLASAAPSSQVVFVLGFSQITAPLACGVIVPFPDLVFPAVSDITGNAHLRLRIPQLHGSPPVQLWTQVLVADPGSPCGFAFSNGITGTLVHDVDSDFNGDGFADLAIGIPDEDAAGAVDSGAVNIAYGSAAGLTNAGTQLIRQGGDVGGVIRGAPQADDGFGAAIAAGDFDGDGYDDLAVGAPREDAAGPARNESGVVQVIYGSPQGLQGGNFGRDDQLFRQELGGLQGLLEDFDWFGKSLIAGDFDGDGYDDLAIGVPFENATEINQGVVQVIFGSPTGLSTAGNLWIDEPHQVAPDDRFGWTLATGDFNSDGFADIAVGRPYENVQGERDAGAVSILYMDANGVDSAVNVHKNVVLGGTAIQGSARLFDLFGFSISVGDYDHDGADDLAVGVPFQDVSGASAAGAVHVIYGSFDVGLVGAGNQLWTQDTGSIVGAAQLGHRFGYALASGDYDHDGDDDLAIGAPRERIAAVPRGAAHILHGSPGAGITDMGTQRFTMSALGLGAGADDDEFSWALLAGDFDGDCGGDLVIGIPGADIGGDDDAGAAAVRYAGATASQLWDQGPLSGAPQAGDRFGAALPGSPDQIPL